MKNNNFTVEKDLWQNLIFKYEIDNNHYLVFSDINDLNEDDDIYISKYNIINGQCIVENIENNDEFIKAYDVFLKIMKAFDLNNVFYGKVEGEY